MQGVVEAARLYARYFPEDFGADLFDEVGNWLRTAGRGGWYILHRRTDFIGEPVNAGAVGPAVR